MNRYSIKNLLLLAVLATSVSLFAQSKVVGFSMKGRSGELNSGGTIFESSPDGSNFKVLKNFVFDQIGNLKYDLAKGPDNFLYGVSNMLDGNLPCIFFFKIEPLSGTLTLLHKFEGFTEALCSPIWGQDGFFYFCGVSTDNEQRKVLRVSTNGQVTQVLANIPAPYSSYQQSAECFQLYNISAGSFVMVLPDNRLARYSAGSSILQIIKQFEEGIDGRVQCIEVAPNGIIYGTLEQFSPFKHRIFQIKSDGIGFGLVETEPIGFDFYSVTDFMVWDDSLMYSINYFGLWQCRILKINLNSKKVDIIFTESAYDTDYGSQKLLKTSEGNLLFATSEGIWKIAPDGTSLDKIVPFNAGWPASKILEMSDHRLYLTLFTYADSKLISTKLDGTDLVTNYSFNPLPSGGAMPAQLIKCSDGKYYGTVRKGGQNGKGYVFTMNPDGSGFNPILNFSNFDIDFDYAVFFEGSDGRLYFGAKREYIADSWGNLKDAYELHSINKNGSGLYTLIESYGAATSCVEGLNGKLNWIEDFYLSRMNKDNTGKEIKWKHFYSGADEYNRIGRLSQLPNGDIFGGVDYYFDDFCSTYGYNDWLSFFLHPYDDITIVTHDMKSMGYVPSSDGKVQRYDYILESVAFYPTETDYSVCTPSLLEGSQLVAEQLAADNLLWGQRAYNDGRFDIIAVNTVSKDCSFTIPWREEMGHHGQFAFETNLDNPSTPTNEIAIATDLKVNPNPTSNSINVAIVNQAGHIRWKLIDFTGKTVSTCTSDTPTFEVIMSALPSGIFQLVGVEENTGRRFSQKVVKQ